MTLLFGFERHRENSAWRLSHLPGNQKGISRKGIDPNAIEGWAIYPQTGHPCQDIYWFDMMREEEIWTICTVLSDAGDVAAVVDVDISRSDRGCACPGAGPFGRPVRYPEV